MYVLQQVAMQLDTPIEQRKEGGGGGKVGEYIWKQFQYTAAGHTCLHLLGF